MNDFAEFYLASKDRVFRTVFAATGSRADAEDAVAEAYTRALARWRRLQQQANPAGWVVITAMNFHRSVWRRRRREDRRDPPERPEVGTSADRCLPSDLRRLVLALPRRQREVVALRLIADLSAEETGRLLGISTATVHVHLHRALIALRSQRTSPAGLADPAIGASTTREILP
ncbi:MAG TPA: sigma-70 family RNA polymerase sigma factor [Micromonosporaceae bacterium]|jgi:RNA polymerase sigma-70 factor (ECF subfamily)